MNSIGIGEIIASQSEGKRGLLKLRSTLWPESLNFVQKLLVPFLRLTEEKKMRFNFKVISVRFTIDFDAMESDFAFLES